MEYLTDESTVEKRMLEIAFKNHQPINGSIELLPLCNMNCDMCYIRLSNEEMKQRGRLRTANEWIEIAKEMEDAGVLFLLLTGGEPLMFPDFKKLYLELKKMGMIITINTNGTLINKEWAEFFEKNKPRRINITLYGSSELAYEKLCHYSKGYSKAINGIKLLKKHGVPVKINGSATKYNKDDIDEIYRFRKELDIPIHIDTYMLPGLHECNKPIEQQSRLLPKDAAYIEMKTLKTELTPESYKNYVQQTIQNIEENKNLYSNCISCLAGNCSFTINWQGYMRPCVSLSYPSISVFETGFADAWKIVSKEANKIILNEKCTHCYLRPICKTCVASAFLETGEYDGISDYLCQYASEFLRLLYIEREIIKNE